MPFEKVVPATAYVFDKEGALVDQGSPPYVKAVPMEGSVSYDPSVEVVWNKEIGQVQVGIELPREQWLSIAKELEGDDWSEVASRSIFTGTLTREQINHMIRTLRRARNAAFGADE